MNKILQLIIINLIFFNFYANAQLSYNETNQFQSKMHFDNNTSMELEINIEREGKKVSSSNWSKYEADIKPWRGGLTMLKATRRGGMKCNKTYKYDIYVKAKNTPDEIVLRMKINPDELDLVLGCEVIGSDMKFKIFSEFLSSGQSFDSGYKSTSNNNKYSETFTFGGKQVKLRMRMVGDQTLAVDDEDVSFVLEEINPFPKPAAADLNDPHTLNILSANIQLLDLLSMDLGNAGGLDLGELAAIFGFEADHKLDVRKKIIGELIYDHFDVIIFQEAFDDFNHVWEDLEDRYPYKSDRLNAYEIDNSQLIFKDGGVRIVSKWPILAEDDWSFRHDAGVVYDPNKSDRYASKGIKYIKIKKQNISTERSYHIFGTHMTTGGGNIEERESFTQFMNLQQIANDDAVIIGGDWNTIMEGAPNSAYAKLIDELNAVETSKFGYPYKETTTNYNYFKYADASSPDDQQFAPNTFEGRAIDFFFTCNDYATPISADAHTYYMRSSDGDMWDKGELHTTAFTSSALGIGSDRTQRGVFDLADHQFVYAKFKFPAIVDQSDSDLTFTCDSTMQNIPVSFGITTNLNHPNMSYEWMKDGVVIPDATGSSLTIADPQPDDAGTYICNINYHIGFDASTNFSLSLDNQYYNPGNRLGQISSDSFLLAYDDNGSNCHLILPLDLLSFDAIPLDNHNLLEWTTTMEENISHIEIQKILDSDNDFETIATREPSSTSSLESINNYRYQDFNPNLIDYYRLKIVDLDESYEYSKIISVNRRNNISFFEISPNPVLDILNVNINAGKDGKVDIKLIDFRGVVLYQMSEELSASNNNLKIRLPDNIIGSFIVQLKMGNHFCTRKMLRY